MASWKSDDIFVSFKLKTTCCFLLRITIAAWSSMFSGAKQRLEVKTAAWTFPIFLVKDTNSSSIGRLVSFCTSVQTDSVAGNKVFLGLLPSLLRAAQRKAGDANYPHG